MSVDPDGATVRRLGAAHEIPATDLWRGGLDLKTKRTLVADARCALPSFRILNTAFPHSLAHPPCGPMAVEPALANAAACTSTATWLPGADAKLIVLWKRY